MHFKYIQHSWLSKLLYTYCYLLCVLLTCFNMFLSYLKHPIIILYVTQYNLSWESKKRVHTVPYC